MIDLIRALAKWEIRAILLLGLLAGGLVLIYLGFFSGFPSSTNAWVPPLRHGLHGGLVAIGCLLLVFAIGLVVGGKRANASAARPAAPSEEKQHPAVLQWFRLPPTQKEIVSMLYENVHKDRIQLEAFFDAFVKKHGQAPVASLSEMFYRLKALKFEGMLELHKVGPQATDVVKINAVRRALLDGDVVKT